MLHKALLGRYCVVVWVSFLVFCFFCFTSLGNRYTEKLSRFCPNVVPRLFSNFKMTEWVRNPLRTLPKHSKDLGAFCRKKNNTSKLVLVCHAHPAILKTANLKITTFQTVFLPIFTYGVWWIKLDFVSVF